MVYFISSKSEENFAETQHLAYIPEFGSEFDADEKPRTFSFLFKIFSNRTENTQSKPFQ